MMLLFTYFSISLGFAIGLFISLLFCCYDINEKNKEKEKF